MTPTAAKAKAGFSSFNTGQIKQEKKDQVVGLNRMDINTFILALTEISQGLFSQGYDEITKKSIYRDQAESFQELVYQCLNYLDNKIQMTEKGNDSQG